MLRIAAAVLVLSGCSAPPGAPASVEVHLTCDTGDAGTPCAFRPSEITVRAGGTVRWINDDDTFHTVTSSERASVRVPDGRFDAVLDGPGETFARTFEEPGVHAYYCRPHAEFMAGTVRVT